MNIFIDICVVIAVSGILFVLLFLICKYGTRKLNTKCTVGATMLALAFSCLLNGILFCLALSAYGYLPKL